MAAFDNQKFGIAAVGNYAQHSYSYSPLLTQTTVDAETLITDSEVDARGFVMISCLLKNTGANSAAIKIYGSNDPSFTEEFAVLSGLTLTSGTTVGFNGSSSTTGQTGAMAAVYGFYRIKIAASVGGSQTTVTARWMLK